jgi:hypothetical protein
MLTTTRTTRNATITRTISISFALAGRCEARVTEQTDNKIVTDTYFLERQPSDFGVAFTVKKIDGEQYDICLNVPGGGHSCDCKWQTYKGHIKPCRHLEMALQALRERKI